MTLILQFLKALSTSKAREKRPGDEVEVLFIDFFSKIIRGM